MIFGDEDEKALRTHTVIQPYQLARLFSLSLIPQLLQDQVLNFILLFLSFILRKK